MAFPLVLAAGALIGGGLSALSASSNNKAQKRAAATNQQSVNAELEQRRLAIYDRMQTLGQETSGRVGSFTNGLRFGSGGSINAVIAQMYAEAYQDSTNLNNELNNTETSASLQRQSIRNQANSQMQSVGLAAVQGGIQGAMTAASLYSAVSSWQAQSRIGDILKNPNTPPWQVDAVMKGIDPSLLKYQSVANLLQAGYSTQSQLTQLGLDAARANANAASAANSFAQQRKAGKF